MQLIVTGLNFARQDRIQDLIENRLSRFSSQISRVNVTLEDQNGPRGGVDKHCCIKVTMPGHEPLVASAQDSQAWAALSTAANRIRRLVVTSMKRPRSLRQRKWRQHRRRDRTPILHSE